MKGLLALLMVLGMSGACFAGEIEATPNLPAATGDQVWVVRNGRIVSKLNANDLSNGEYVQIGSQQVGCFPRQQPPVPQYPAPPQFVPAPPVGPPLPPVAVDGGVDLLAIALSVLGALGGYVYGKKAAKDDDDDTDEVAVAAV